MGECGSKGGRVWEERWESMIVMKDGRVWKEGCQSVRGMVGEWEKKGRRV